MSSGGLKSSSKIDMSKGFLPSLGAYPARDLPGAFRFAVWAPEASNVELLLLPSEPSNQPQSVHLVKDGIGVWTTTRSDVRAGQKYQYRVDGKGPFPDPASRSQPDGVHGPSQVVDPSTFQWSDHEWKKHERRHSISDMVIYELHIGTFTPSGTFAGAIEKLPYLKELGVTTIEIMPVNDFPGSRNWGYDGVALYAPARCYGTPDDLRRLVDEAHRIGLSVMLDVVYNHLGPDGNYLGAFSPYYFSDRKNPWGHAVNIDPLLAKAPEHAHHVRRFFIENAAHWLVEYHFDGLRLDATHELVDTSPKHFLAELVVSCQDAVRHACGDPACLPVIVAEDDRNDASLLLPDHHHGGVGLSALWADDFHHQVRVMLAGDRHGYYENFEGSVDDLVTTIKQGWFFTGQQKKDGKSRGTRTDAIRTMSHFIYHIQNHDQVGNRAFGDRITAKIDSESYKAASALLLLLPETPMLFMGQEWAATSPFCFFTDHNEGLGKLVTEGRRKEFQHFPEFADPEMREKIPDPQAESTFQSSKLRWDECSQGVHSDVLSFYKDLLRLRKEDPAFRPSARERFEVHAIGPDAVAVERRAVQAVDGAAIVLINFKGDLHFSLRDCQPLFALIAGAGTVVTTVLNTQGKAAPISPRRDVGLEFDFSGPAVRVLRVRGSGSAL